MGSYIILFIIFIEIIGLLIFIFIGYKHLQIIIKNKININSENKKFDKLITQGNKKQINKKKINWLTIFNLHVDKINTIIYFIN